ncbi:hypothetical protein [Kumtagia ephedrae]|uniref:Uncharacterized protein n=1 Tax=Kumtagia ephedrae TaxID=2116701 RepID=A0A2P7S5H4_9HYPH|nr:hypothetical protein [Mesorhizobium ephedrae]PSJ57689.1 hypothetical protein C7I84_16785 [Mesorhizobium ephedrae]
MNWTVAIDRNREALKRILAMLVAMAGLGDGGQFPFFRQKGRGSPEVARAEKSRLSPALTPALTLPRHLHRAVLKLLYPAEAAVRRLIVVAARGLVVALPTPRPREPKPAIPRKAGRPGMPLPPQNLARRVAALPLLDPLRMPRPWNGRAWWVPRSVPRISFPGYSVPFRIPPPPSPDDPVDATRLAQRLRALAAALDDLPAQARRFARWRARRDAAFAQERGIDAGTQDGKAGGTRRLQRLRPLKPGRPPGWRRKPDHPVHEVLNELHGLAFDALQRPDTS